MPNYLCSSYCYCEFNRRRLGHSSRKYMSKLIKTYKSYSLTYSSVNMRILLLNPLFSKSILFLVHLSKKNTYKEIFQ